MPALDVYTQEADEDPSSIQEKFVYYGVLIYGEAKNEAG